MHNYSGIFLGLLVSLWSVSPSPAQMFSQSSERPRSIRSLSAGYQWTSFQYNGSRQPTQSFDYEAPAYAISFTQPSLQATVAFGRQSAQPGSLRELRLLDAEMFLWGGFPITGSRTLRIYLPLVLYSGYRSVDERDQQTPSIDAFNLTTLGLGSGLALEGSLAGDVRLDAQVTPVGGLALRTLEGTAGRSWLLRSRAQLHIPRLIRRYGLSIGYSYRYQRWNVDASDLFPTISDDLFDYKNRQHILHLGVNW
jgi:hypothetical protein